LWEQSDLDADGVIDELASYSYGENNSATQQTSKTVVAGSALNSPHSTLSYSYDLQGRMATTVVERFAADGVTVIDRESTSFDYDHTGIRVTAHNKLERVSSSTGLLVTLHELDTTYLVDHQNFTGYEQVLREVTTDATGYVVRKVVYTLGHDVVSQWSAGFISSYAPEYDPENGGMSFSNVPTGSHLFLYDGHGSVRSILPRGRYWDIGIDKSFTYDAYGNALGFNPTFAGTVILYRGEQYDVRIGLGYNRRRYVDFWTGTFPTRDPFAGYMHDPQSLHKYAYGHGNPIGNTDPTGEYSLGGVSVSIGISGVLGGTVSYARGGSFFEGFAYGAVGGAVGYLAFPLALAAFGGGTTFAGFYGALASTGFVSGASVGGLQSWMNNRSALDITFDALESGVLGASVSILFGPFFSGKYVARPNTVTNANFAQSAINRAETFSKEGIKVYSKAAGRPINTVDDLVDAIADGTVDASQLAVDFVIKDGVKLILNTRTSTALTRAAVPRSQWYGRDVTGTRVPGLGQTTFDELAEAQLRNNNLAPQGTPNPPS
jgi:RHS repeat-associated protein